MRKAALSGLVAHARQKTNFVRLEDYVEFCARYLEFVASGLQAVIVSQNENHYNFYQYKRDGHFNVTRPINSRLMYDVESLDEMRALPALLANARDLPSGAPGRNRLTRGLYTVQQSIGATLDALPAGQSNAARKVNGDLFERLIQLSLQRAGVDCRTGTVQVPVVVDGQEQFRMSYQHDLLLHRDGEVRVVGSAKTSSKDRIDKIFLDKFLYSRLTETALPHIAVFLNDVQRKQTRRENQYGVNSTFLSGHFKGFTIKLNALDGVYYCDLRPNMTTDELLKQHIRGIDHLFCTDVWNLLERDGLPDEDVVVQEQPQTT